MHKNMNEYRKQLRKDLGYDVDEQSTDAEVRPTNTAIPGRYFAYSAIAVFIGGVVGMATELDSEEIKYLLIYFSMSFFVAPALLIFPVIRLFIGEEKTGLAAFLSALFGYYVQSSVKKRMK